jgi:cell division protein FtsI (penicillin-binding protein 3)
MPDVKGMGLSDAVYLLESRGYSVTHSGEGRVRRQTLSNDKLTIHLGLW